MRRSGIRSERAEVASVAKTEAPREPGVHLPICNGNERAAAVVATARCWRGRYASASMMAFNVPLGRIALYAFLSSGS